jgi:hypothetical protein
MDEPDRGPDDVLSMGEGRSPRWGVLAVLLAVLLLGAGAYRLVSGPSAPAGAEPAAAAEDQPAAVSVPGGRSGFGEGGGNQGVSLELGGNLVTLRGPGVQQAHRETAATSLRRVHGGWLVRLTSRACEDRTDATTSYGVARPSGRFTAWESASTARRPTWRSPDRALVLVERGARVELRRTSTGAVLDRFRAQEAGRPNAR